MMSSDSLRGTGQTILVQPSILSIERLEGNKNNHVGNFDPKLVTCSLDLFSVWVTGKHRTDQVPFMVSGKKFGARGSKFHLAFAAQPEIWRHQYVKRGARNKTSGRGG